MSASIGELVARLTAHTAPFERQGIAMKKKLLTTIILVVSLGLIGYGVWLVYHPLGFVVVGLLLWVDLLIGSLRKTA